MKCPYCGDDGDKVIDSRPSDEGLSIRRRRECLSCTKRFTTYEKIENIPIIVIKKDNSRQVFDRMKLLNGIIKACEKRNVSIDKIEKIIDDIENQVCNSFEREINSYKLGEQVMLRLRKIDDVAYIRFASVYKEFKDIPTFMDELSKIMKEEN